MATQGGRRASTGAAVVRRAVGASARDGRARRSERATRWRTPFLADRHASTVRRLRADLLHWLPELADAPPGIADAVELATSFEAWDRLRSEQRLGRARAAAAMERIAVSLLASLDS